MTHGALQWLLVGVVGDFGRGDLLVRRVSCIKACRRLPLPSLPSSFGLRRFSVF